MIILPFRDPRGVAGEFGGNFSPVLRCWPVSKIISAYLIRKPTITGAVWSFREQFSVLRISQLPPIITENRSQFMSKLRFLNIFFLKPGITKKFHFIKNFQFSLDGAVSFMPEIFNFGCSVQTSFYWESGLAKSFVKICLRTWPNHFLMRRPLFF